ncbi:MAG TPA: tRNA 2-thiocytidine(32) synthetase TtcA [Lentisphaeria bacterium]|nr:tRNA 2-thiocytidine(32) synthetase TtcA [Lentisphaeria bacterium]
MSVASESRVHRPISDLAEGLRRRVTTALHDYQMLGPDDRVLVAVSGGKDSTALLLLLEETRRRASFSFSLQPVILDQKQPGFLVDEYRDWLASRGFSLAVIERDTYSVVVEKIPEGKTYCSLCARLRRGILYNYAHQNGFTKIALGHHREDANETILMNMLFSGRIAAMPPKLRSDDGRNTVIRPLCNAPEADIAKFAREQGYPIIPCNLCGNQANLQRARIKRLLGDLSSEHPRIAESLLAAQGNVQLQQLRDRDLWNFSTFEQRGVQQSTRN